MFLFTYDRSRDATHGGRLGGGSEDALIGVDMWPACSHMVALWSWACRGHLGTKTSAPPLPLPLPPTIHMQVAKSKCT